MNSGHKYFNHQIRVKKNKKTVGLLVTICGSIVLLWLFCLMTKHVLHYLVREGVTGST